MACQRLTASFRDPSGFVFRDQGRIFRQVNLAYRPVYDRLKQSGLFKALVESRLLVEHEEVEGVSSPDASSAWKILKPRHVRYISYPYEWCFGQLKSAALTTLAVQRKALEYGMTLKDASAFNIQHEGATSVLLDTLSFDLYEEGQPWQAYRQFCQHFLAPLALVAFVDVRFGTLSSQHLDGIPLDLACKLMPARARFNPGLLMHLFLHSREQSRHAGRNVKARGLRVSKQGLHGILESLENTIKGLTWSPGGTEWADYYSATNYTANAADEKRRIITDFLVLANPGEVWDLGANTGVYSRMASTRQIPTLAFDMDPSAVETNYALVQKQNETFLLPLVLNLTNPSPALGWAHAERSSWMERGPVDLAMALALVHHLAVSNNVPLAWIAEMFRQMCRWLIIEFVPKADSQVQRLLASRRDVYPDYNDAVFRKEFSRHFEIISSVSLHDSSRTLFLMKNRTRPSRPDSPI